MPSRIQEILDKIAANKRVANAYMFVGPPGSGKKSAAEEFGRKLKISKQDFLLVVPDGASIKIDQVKEVQSLVRYGPSDGKYFLVVLDKADTLTDPATTAMLKILEEPPAGVVFILLVEREDRVPQTIHSRCQKIFFPEPADNWAANREYVEIKSNSPAELLLLSKKISAEKDEIENLLYNSAYYARGNAKAARIMLDTVRFIKRRANVKLAVDVMCLKLGEVYASSHRA